MDNVTIYPPGGGSPPAPTVLPIGSWLMADPGPDYGSKGLITSLESSNALTDGGRFAARFAPPRKMQLPLIINSLYGVNRLLNPDFETATYQPWINTQSPSGYAASAAVVSDSVFAGLGGPLPGSYALIATVIAASGEFRMVSPDIPQSALPGVVGSTYEPLLMAGQYLDFTGLGFFDGPRGALRLNVRQAGGPTVFYPDTPAPGYIFGFTNAGTQGTGSFSAMSYPNKVWNKIGGIFSAQLLASMLTGASNIFLEYLGAFNPSVPSANAGTYGMFALNKLEFRSAYQQRAVREWEAQIREYSTPGAYISVQPEGVPSSEAVFFDVIDGRWEPDYNIYENRAGVRKGTLYLDTQPWGYWPTEILLASVASVGPLGQVPVNGASVIGDVPPLARVQVIPTVASCFLFIDFDGPTSIHVDMLAVSFAGRPSFSPFIPPAAFVPSSLNFSGTPGGLAVPSLIADAFAPASQAVAWGASAAVERASGGWQFAAFSAANGISSALEPAYRGRFRAFGFFKQAVKGPAPTQAIYVMLDTERDVMPSQIMYPLASSNQLATFGVASDIFNVLAMGSNGYQMLDMGEITLPPNGSGLQTGERLRLWVNVFPNVASRPLNATIMFGGVFLLPLDGPAGIVAKGMYAPTINGGFFNAATQGGVEFNGQFAERVLSVPISSGLSPVGGQVAPLSDLAAYYRGVSLRLGASVNSLTFLTADRNNADPFQTWQGNVEHSSVSVSYRPSFQFLYGV